MLPRSDVRRCCVDPRQVRTQLCMVSRDHLSAICHLRRQKKPRVISGMMMKSSLLDQAVTIPPHAFDSLPLRLALFLCGPVPLEDDPFFIMRRGNKSIRVRVFQVRHVEPGFCIDSLQVSVDVPRVVLLPVDSSWSDDQVDQYERYVSLQCSLGMSVFQIGPVPVHIPPSCHSARKDHHRSTRHTVHSPRPNDILRHSTRVRSLQSNGDIDDMPAGRVRSPGRAGWGIRDFGAKVYGWAVMDVSAPRTTGRSPARDFGLDLLPPASPWGGGAEGILPLGGELQGPTHARGGMARDDAPKQNRCMCATPRTRRM